MPPLPVRIVLLLSTVLVLPGCATPVLDGQSPLVAPRMSPDSVVLEVFSVRCPIDDPEVNGPMWQQIDEQRLPPDLRRRLARNGLRVGVVGGQVPMALTRLMELKNKPISTGESAKFEMGELECEPAVMRHRLTIRNGGRKEVVVSNVYDQLNVLLVKSGELCGETYCKAQALFAVTTALQRDGRVRVQLVPELHHDEVRSRFVGNQGMMRLEAGRPREAFSDLAFSVDLAPGSMLLIGSLPERPGSLGHHFLTETKERLQQKLLVVRLTQTQHDDLFSPPEVLRLEE